ncbi:DNA polymerase III subunit delta' [Pseudoxanthomonas kalamensis DSM 18571]|uniref:DNA polymerase III subunit delta' n=1 Tax=Pseudoxanthomonas kalamensis TaxID=289483 RepID=UPI001390C49C|nr:DNA polymerase III subunit delta' [Pseudoxanthomonas kalamensis]KAF1709894.1 DNA polymerase III subunit delta' [Pseudoxanthomonas kalamensis DSM 18571]
MSETFAPWQQRIYDHALSALRADRLGHGLLVCGPAGLGKRAVAERLAQYVLCGGEPTPQDRNLQLIRAGTHPDLSLVSFIPNAKGDKLRTEIVIDQIRALSQRLALTPQYGRAQVVIIDPADAINRSAFNALLKTLEEPAPGRYLWLISANPMRLPATIRSRCQRLEFRLPPADEALAWLRRLGHAEADAARALEAARGHPGLADEWLQSEGLALRQQVAGDLERLARGEIAVVETAQRWTGDEHAALRLRHAADLALARAAGAASDGLTDPSQLHKLAVWFDTANRTRDLLDTTVRGDLAVADLLLAWRSGMRAAAANDKRGGRR